GVPPAGAADPFALAAANALVGNTADAAGIEIIGTPFRFTCDDSRLVAVTGRDVSLATRTRLDGWGSVFVRAGQVVTVHCGERTRFAYLALSGGIATRAVLGSRATYLPAGLGAPLRAGDPLPRGGAPIVLLADHQTTGGYPVIATVIAADLGKVAQRMPGESLRFYRVERNEALDALRAERRALDGVRISA